MLNFFLPVFFMATGLCNSLTAQSTLYVSTTGDNANDGLSLATAFGSIQKALNKAVPGTTIRVAEGTYREYLSWKQSGTAGNPITLTAHSGKVVVHGKGENSVDQKAIIEITDHSHIVISDLFIQQNYKADAGGIAIRGSGTDITIQGCKIRNIGWTKTSTAQPGSSNNASPLTVIGTGSSPIADLKIIGNTIQDCITGYSEALTINGNVDGFVIRNNTIRDITNIGIVLAGHYSWTGAPASQNMARNGTVLNNTVYNCVSPVATSAGIYVDGGRDITIDRNTVYANGCGISVGCENNGHTVSGIMVRNNFIYNNKEAGLVFGSNQSNSSVNNSIVRNNTFYRNYNKGGWGTEITLQNNSGNDILQNIFVPFSDQCVAIGKWNFTATGLTVDDNLYWRTSGNTNNSFFANIDGEGDALTGDPKFKNAGSFDLHLNNGSPAINTGASNFEADNREKDVDGDNRIINGRVDIGADEYR